MRWKKGRRSSNIEDRRGQSVGRRAAVGGGGLVALLAIAAFFIPELRPVVDLVQTQQQSASVTQQRAPQQRSAAEDEAADFVSVVLADTEDVWSGVFAQAGSRYQPPGLVLYTDATRTGACGLGEAAAGPFYCPPDNKVYLDLSFLNELRRLGAPGDFAFAYVIAHEVGHHVQNITGVADQVRAAKARMSKVEANALQVKMELQADCYAGVWAHHAHRERQVLEPGDVEEGLDAAASVGDDRLQQAAGRRVHPESWTHGSSEQRMRWFQQGLQTGSVDSCNTFS